MPKTSTEFIKMGDIPDEFINEILAFLHLYCVPLYQGEKLLGSGTLIRVDQTFGILTARHVLANQEPPIQFKDSLEENILLSIDQRWHRFTLPHALLSEIIIATPDIDQKGPDLTFIKIENSHELETLKRKKGFWDLSNYYQGDYFDKSKSGLLYMAGYPAEKCDIRHNSEGDLELMSFCLGLAGFADSTYEKENFDYIELKCHYHENPELPKNYGGMSGCGLWHVNILHKKKSDTFTYDHNDIRLCGVAFYQEPESDGIMKITGHGSASLLAAISTIREMS
jgi:hypothetical protein